MRHSCSRGYAWLCALAAGFTALCAAEPGAAAPIHYHLIKSVTLGGEGGWDYITVDPETRRLYITRGTHVIVVDDRTGAVVGDIGDLKGIHGVAFLGDHGYVTNGGANTVVVFDRHSLKKLGEITAGMRPDGILADEASGRVFAFNGGSGDATAIDAASGTVAGTVALGGKPEAASVDDSDTVFVNIEDKSEIAAFNAKTLALERRWPLAPCESPSGQAIDVKHHRLFSGCENSIIAVSDTNTGKVVTTIPIGRGVDSNRFDPSDDLVFSSNGFAGTLTVAREVTPDRYEVLENVPTAMSARTMELDPTTHRVYTVAAEVKFGPPPAPGQRRVRPTIVPGTFRLLILGR